MTKFDFNFVISDKVWGVDKTIKIYNIFLVIKLLSLKQTLSLNFVIRILAY